MGFTGENYPGVQTPTKESEGFRLNHTMLRIKDPEKSLAFYTHVMGMTVLRRLDFEEMQFSLYFLTKVQPDQNVPEAQSDRTVWTFSQTGILEFTHNWGTETEDNFAYHDGNAQPQGFGHICFSVPDLDAAIAWFDANNLTYVKRPEQGKMRDVAFIKDVDGYWIEIVEAARLGQLGA
ncbi:MAG: lactoylglutathione lyase [Marinobacter sp.]|uniref:lactoylglutathione lyase n=1 Tax=Marinobacter sp. TaxID=50741 RepID=UPI0034A09C37